MKFLVFGNLMALDQETLDELNEKLKPLNIELVVHSGSGETGYIYVNIAWQTLLKRVLKAYPDIKEYDENRKLVRRNLIETQTQLDAKAEALGDRCFAIGERDLEHLDGLVELFKFIAKENS